MLLITIIICVISMYIYIYIYNMHIYIYIHIGRRRFGNPRQRFGQRAASFLEGTA